MSKSFDHAGPACRTVEDTAIMLNALVDEDFAGVAINFKNYRTSLAKKIKPRVGVITDAETSEEMKGVFSVVVELFQSWGWQLTSCQFRPGPTSGFPARM